MDLPILDISHKWRHTAYHPLVFTFQGLLYFIIFIYLFFIHYLLKRTSFLLLLMDIPLDGSAIFCDSVHQSILHSVSSVWGHCKKCCYQCSDKFFHGHLFLVLLSTGIFQRIELMDHGMAWCFTSWWFLCFGGGCRVAKPLIRHTRPVLRH